MALESIQLSWGIAPKDLDLHLAVFYNRRWTAVDFRSKGSTESFPWASLDSDVTDGYGPETITISRLVDAAYRCYVHNYSGESSLATACAELLIRFRASNVRLSCPLTTDGRFWLAFDFSTAHHSLTVINSIVETDPTQSPYD